MTSGRRTIGVLVFVTVTGLWAAPPSGAAPAKVAGAPLVYIRSGPGPTSEPLGVLSEGTELETLGVEGSWTRVRVVSDGRVGYVYSTFLDEQPEPTPTEAPAEPAVGAARESPGGREENRETPGESVVAGELGERDRRAPPPPTPDPFLLEEVARLRTEVDSLKRQVATELVGGGGSEETADDGDLADPALRSAGIAVIFLVIGWFFGMAYARRRTQRPRLRF